MDILGTYLKGYCPYLVLLCTVAQCMYMFGHSQLHFNFSCTYIHYICKRTVIANQQSKVEKREPKIPWAIVCF